VSSTGAVCATAGTAAASKRSANRRAAASITDPRRRPSAFCRPVSPPYSGTRRRAPGGDTLPLFARSVQLRRGRPRRPKEPRLGRCKSRRHAKYARLSAPGRRAPRATRRPRWQSSGSRSAHIRHRQCRAGSAVSRPRPARKLGVRAIAYSRLYRHNRAKDRAAGRRAHRRTGDRRCCPWPEAPRDSLLRTRSKTVMPAPSARRQPLRRRRRAASRRSDRRQDWKWPMLNRSKLIIIRINR